MLGEKASTDIIFDLIKLRRVNPWDIKISEILKEVSRELCEKGYFQFTISGLVLFASSIIYLRKTEALLLTGPDSKSRVEEEGEDLDIPLEIIERISPMEAPLRPSQPVIDLEYLVKALSEILRKAYSQKAVEEEPLPPIVPQVDEFLREIEKKVEEFKKSICEAIFKNGKVSVNSLLEGKDSLEAARTFILILFILSEPGFDLHFENGEYYIVVENDFQGFGV
ncbi:MAG: hypothetical protein ACUVQ0_03435 [Thermoproteota archaeon]